MSLWNSVTWDKYVHGRKKKQYTKEIKMFLIKFQQARIL